MFVLVNLKTYDCDPHSIAAAVKEAEDSSSARVAVAPQALHLAAIADTGVETWAQHVDPDGPGSHTGATEAGTAADVGAAGTLLNHSERRLSLADIQEGITRATQVGLETVVCANTAEQIRAAAALGPSAVAVEPPELIGTGTPVSQANPRVVTDSVEAAGAVDPSVDVLCGAGISTGADVAAARDLGADGVLLASGVAMADDPAAALSDLLSPL